MNERDCRQTEKMRAGVPVRITGQAVKEGNLKRNEKGR
jgi:hypothetical protein